MDGVKLLLWMQTDSWKSNQAGGDGVDLCR